MHSESVVCSLKPSKIPVIGRNPQFYLLGAVLLIVGVMMVRMRREEPSRSPISSGWLELLWDTAEGFV